MKRNSQTNFKLSNNRRSKHKNVYKKIRPPEIRRFLISKTISWIPIIYHSTKYLYLFIYGNVYIVFICATNIRLKITIQQAIKMELDTSLSSNIVE